MGLAQVFGVRVRQLRRARGWSQEALADAVGLAVTYVGQIERGQRNPSLRVVEKFAEILQVDAPSLLTATSLQPGDPTESGEEP